MNARLPAPTSRQGRTITLAGPRGRVPAPAPGVVFTWHADFQASEWRLVLLSAEHRELAWSSPQTAMTYRPEGWFRQVLNRPGRYSWYAIGTKGGSQVRSDLVDIEVR